MPLAKIETMIVTENSRKMRPISPLMNTSGMNTAASEIVIDRIVKLISLRRFERCLQRRSAPSSIRRTVFSRNTIASSTRNPIASVNAISERLSRL